MTIEGLNTEGRVQVTLIQARRLAELGNKAEWHSARQHGAMAFGYLMEIREVLKGVKDPGAGSPLGDLFREAHEGSPNFDDLRHYSLAVLEQLEKTLYKPIRDGQQ